MLLRSTVVYPPEVREAMVAYAAHLKDARARVEGRVRDLELELREYGVGVEGGENKEKVMREMARVYRGMRKEVEEVKDDLQRLKGR